MVQIARTNSAIVGLDLYTVAERHQSGLVEVIIQEQIKSWKSNPYFLSAIAILFDLLREMILMNLGKIKF